MATLIDTSILIEAERGRLDLVSKISESEAETYMVSVVTASELLHGLHRAKDTVFYDERQVFIERIFEQFPLISIDLAIARKHSKIWAELAMAGKMIGMNDLWIAATCLAQNLSLVTGNVRDFERISGLEIEVWQ